MKKGNIWSNKQTRRTTNKQRMSRVRRYNELLHGKKGFRQKEKGGIPCLC